MCYNEFDQNVLKYKEVRAIAHYNSTLKQITSFIPRHDFEYHANNHHQGLKFWLYNRWSQFMAMMIGQLSGRKSLWNITDNLKVRGKRLYHLGMKPTPRATFARVNEQQPASFYQLVFNQLLSQCQGVAPKHRFSFKSKRYLLDTTTVDLCLSVFPWAEFRKRKEASRLHTGLDADGYLPAFMNMTNGKVHEINRARTLTLPKGSFLCFDLGFTDYNWFSSLMDNGLFFVIRLKSNADIEYLNKRAGLKNKRIKQNLKIKKFLGTSSNAVLTLVWIALCVYLLISFLKFKTKLGSSMTKILRVLQLNLFERRILSDLFRSPNNQHTVFPQLLLWGQTMRQHWDNRQKE